MGLLLLPKIIPIVEGSGDVAAVPILLRNLLTELSRFDLQIGTPQNAHGCGNLTTPGGIERFVKNAWSRPDCGAVLILMDAENQCPKRLATDFSERIRMIGVRFPVVIVIAKCEYEAWFLASVKTIAGRKLDGRPGLNAGLEYLDAVEERVGVKGWLTRQFPKGRIYKETLDQAAMTHFLDPVEARKHSRSFRRLSHALEQITEAIDNNQKIVTP